MSTIGPIDALSRAGPPGAHGEGRDRVLEYLSKASSALEGVTDELERDTLTDEDCEAIAPALQGVSDAVQRLRYATSARPVPS